MIATRGRRPPQHANSAQGAGRLRVATRGGWTSTLSTITRGVRHHVHTLDDHPGGWHTNREGERAILVSHLAISCRDPKQFARTLVSVF